jgi:hypothetical protein
MMATPKIPHEKPRKFEVVYKDDDGTESIWKYDLDKFPNGPISTETKYPAGYMKELAQRQKLAKLEKKQSTLEKAKANGNAKKR